MDRPSPHFTWAELQAPSPHLIANIARLAATLETIREAVGSPVIVTSGYRTKAHNKAVGGSPSSDHPNGLAADITVPGYSSRDLANRARSALLASGASWDQIIWYASDRHVHVGIGHRMRRMFFQGG